MKSLTEHLWFEIPGRRGFINITPQVEKLVSQSGVREGLCLVNAMHITASVFINDDESGLHHDYEVWLEKLAPHAPTSAYRHNRTGEDNADAHLKRQIMGREIVVAITEGKLDLGPCHEPRFEPFNLIRGCLELAFGARLAGADRDDGQRAPLPESHPQS